MDLKGKVVLVTGAASGLGRATCLELAARGACIGAADSNEPAVDDLVSTIGDNAMSLPLDVTDENDVRHRLTQLAGRFGALHIAVSCAGIPDAHLLVPRDGSSPGEIYRRVVEVNLIGTFNVMSYVAALMVTNERDPNGERGVIINTASVAAWQGQKGQIGYSASKAGVIGMMRPAARELSGQGIRVLTIAPGLFDTAMAAGVPSVRDSLLGMVLEPKRIGKPTEFAALVAHAVENSYLNAAVINIDAGIYIGN